MLAVRNLVAKHSFAGRAAAAFSKCFASASAGSGSSSGAFFAASSGLTPRRTGLTPSGLPISPRKRMKGPIPEKHRKPPIPQMLPKGTVVKSRNTYTFPNFRIFVMKNGVEQKKGTNYKEITLRMPVTYGKWQIREFLKKVYNVNVIKVNTLNYEGKRLRPRKGTRRRHEPNYKKAYVTVDDSDEPIRIPPTPEEKRASEEAAANF